MEPYMTNERAGDRQMKSFKEWLGEGESIYGEAMGQYKELEQQLADIEARLADKKEEVNQIAAVIGKPPIPSKMEAARAERMGQVQIMDRESAGSIPASRQTIAKVLAGKSIG
jgi:hypothetical protein